MPKGRPPKFIPRIPRVVVVKNKDGSTSSERTTSVSHEALNKGKETLIPTLVEGRQLSVPKATRRAIDSDLDYPSFDSPEKATVAAHKRSHSGGATTHGFLGKFKTMANHPASHKKETNKEFQSREFPARIRAVGIKADKVLAPGSKATDKEKAQARKAIAAALRVGSRLAKKGKGASRAAATKPGTDSSRSEKVRSKIRKGTGTDVTHNKLKGVADLAEAAKKKTGN